MARCTPEQLETPDSVRKDAGTSSFSYAEEAPDGSDLPPGANHPGRAARLVNVIEAAYPALAIGIVAIAETFANVGRNTDIAPVVARGQYSPASGANLTFGTLSTARSGRNPRMSRAPSV